MSLSFINNKDGVNLAKIHGGQFNNQIVSVFEPNAKIDEKKTFDEIDLKKNGKFKLCPTNKERNCIFITGQSGSGKSYVIKEFIVDYKNLFPKREIYFFSQKTEDKTVDEIKNKFNRMRIDDTLLAHPLHPDDFKECLVIFDDVENLPKKYRDHLYWIRDCLLELKRQDKVSVIIVNHLPTGLEIKKVLNECNIIVFFLANWNRGLKYLLYEYLGLDKHELKKLRKLNTRASYYFKMYPNVVMTDHNMWIRRIIDDDDDDTTIRVVEDNSSKKTGKGNDDIYESPKICDTCLYSYINYDTHKKTLHHLNALDLKHQPK